MKLENLLESVLLNHHQRLVLLQIKLSETPALAYERVSGDEANIKSRDMLRRFGYIKLSEDRGEVVLTDKGTSALTRYGLIDDMGETTEVGQELIASYQ